MNTLLFIALPNTPVRYKLPILYDLKTIYPLAYSPANSNVSPRHVNENKFGAHHVTHTSQRKATGSSARRAGTR